MFSHSTRALFAGLFVLGTTAALGLAGTATAAAVPPSSVDLQSDWDMYQRPSGTTGDPLGFHVTVTWHETNAANTIVSFNGFADSLTGRGKIEPGEGHIQGRSIGFTIHWSEGKTGVYQGSWFDDGYLRGTTREDGTGRTAEWWSRYDDWSLTPAH
ncbi:hypothetical protein [Nocardia sp. alder85J]|uniref:hypothetical protein n=1 Tax=Nocardia sp. alder85J TaxID=2862949 RepID=UPI001CD4A861|nr:hypothetical protein [Nocardia sp. alder85J]MCX4094228.1 hypothetical protein [Nocardia sp. alder85J]